MPVQDLAAAKQPPLGGISSHSLSRFPIAKDTHYFFSFPLFFKDTLSSLTLTPRGNMLGSEFA